MLHCLKISVDTEKTNTFLYVFHVCNLHFVSRSFLHFLFISGILKFHNDLHLYEYVCFVYVHISPLN